MSAPWEFVCPVCEREFRAQENVRRHCEARAKGDGNQKDAALHTVAAGLPDLAYKNPSFGERNFGVWSWGKESPEVAALAPLRTAKETTISSIRNRRTWKHIAQEKVK